MINSTTSELDGKFIPDGLPARSGGGGRGWPAGRMGLASVVMARLPAERIAEESQRHLRGLIDALAPSIIVGLLTPEGNLIEVNEAPLIAGGFKAEGVLGRPLEETLWSSSSAEAREQLREAITRAAQGEACRYDVRTSGDGDEVMDLDFSLQPLRNEAGEVVLLVPFAIDITERKRVEARLVANAHQLRLLCEMMSNREFTFAQKMPRLLQAACLQLGLEEGLLTRIQVDLHEVAYRSSSAGPELAREITSFEETICREVLRRDECLAVEDLTNSEWCSHAAGLQACLVAPVRVAGRLYGALCFTSTQPHVEKFTSADLDLVRLFLQLIGAEIERQETADALSESKRRLEEAHLAHQRIMDHSLDVICTLDAEGRFVTVSRACEQLWGYAPAELIGRPYIELVYPDDRAKTREIAGAIVAGQSVLDFENRYVRKDGSILPVTWSAKWSEADQGMFCVARDSTERNQAKEAQTARHIAEAANRAKSDFLSRMSHELRTPMNAILGFAQLLESEESLSGDHRESVEQILKGGHHLLGLIKEVLDLSTIEAGRMTLSPEPVGLEELLKESVTLLEPLAKECRITLTVLPGDAAGRYVQADRQRLKQVLLNLVGNAIKYNRRGGSVTVRATLSEGAAGGDTAATIRLSVIDTGAGLSAERLGRLFQPFERLGAEESTVEGSGLGLVLSKRMIELMGGILGVESIVGEGTTFWLELPAAEPPLEQGEPCRVELVDSRPPAPMGRRLVVYIEDNLPNLVLIQRIFARRPGLRVITATDGRLGLGVVRDQMPDLVLLDLNLPDMSGQEVLARLRADPRTSEVPVIILSADASPGQIARLLAGGANDYVTKPLDVRVLLAAVDSALTLVPSPNPVCSPEVLELC